MTLEAENLREAVFYSLGAASVCWDNMSGTGVFDSRQAEEIGDDLIAWLEKRWREAPWLGLVSNQQLKDEMDARLLMGHTDPYYRTVFE